MLILDSTGATVLELGDDAIVGGYVAMDWRQGQRTHRRATVSSDYVDGEYDAAASLRRRLDQLDVFIEGSDWATIRARHRALLAAVEASAWFLYVDDDTVLECAKADSDSPVPCYAYDAEGRIVTLFIPVQPHYGF